MIGDTDISSVQASAAAPKKKMGFLQRMTSSSSAVHKEKEAQKHGKFRLLLLLIVFVFILEAAKLSVFCSID